MDCEDHSLQLENVSSRYLPYSSNLIINFVYSNFVIVTAAVEALSAGILICLFLLQKFGTSRVSFLFSPIMGLWTLTTPIIGVYSFLRYYPGIFKALSPHYIIKFFLTNGREGWKLLGGTVLCITGIISESFFFPR